MSLRTFLFGKDADNEKGRPAKKRSRKLYDVIYEGFDYGFCDTQTDKQVLARVNLYKTEAGGMVSDATNKMQTTHTPKIFFEYAGYAEKYLKGCCVLKKYYPRLFKNAAKELSDFLALRTQCFYAFADRFFVRVEREFKQSQNRGRAELSRLAVYEKEMLPEERQYYINKKSKL